MRRVQHVESKCAVRSRARRMEGSRPDLPRVPHEPRHVNDLSSLFQLREHLACGGVALVGKAPQFLEVALLASKLDELINRILVTAIGTFWRDG